MPLSTTEHLDNLLRHLDLVRNNCILLGKRLMSKGREQFARNLIVRGFRHDLSKFYDKDEWEYLHNGKDTPKDKLDIAIRKHRSHNRHHPEYHGGLHKMGELDVAECVCDWLARAQEFGTDIREWIENNAVKKYRIDKKSRQYEWINNFVDVLLQNEFVE